MRDIMIENNEFKGQVKAVLEFNDKEHQRLYEAIEKLRDDVMNMKLKVAMSGAKWGAITGAIVSVGGYLGISFVSHITK